jgi:hypothetical protein
MGGGVSGSGCSDDSSDRSPISERLPTVNRLVIEPVEDQVDMDKKGERETLLFDVLGVNRPAGEVNLRNE